MECQVDTMDFLREKHSICTICNGPCLPLPFSILGSPCSLQRLALPNLLTLVGFAGSLVSSDDQDDDKAVGSSTQDGCLQLSLAEEATLALLPDRSTRD